MRVLHDFRSILFLPLFLVDDKPGQQRRPIAVAVIGDGAGAGSDLQMQTQDLTGLGSFAWIPIIDEAGT